MNNTASYVYFLTNGNHTKIGKSNSPMHRLKSLATGSSTVLEILYTIKCKSSKEAFLLEQELHTKYNSKKCNLEWFNLSILDYKDIEATYKPNIYTKCNVTRLGDGVFGDTAIEQFETFTPQEWYVFKLLKQEALVWDIDEGKYITTCKVQINPKALTAQDRNKFTIGYKRLETKQLVKRVKRGGSYMINPNLLIPTKYNAEQAEWLTLT